VVVRSSAYREVTYDVYENVVSCESQECLRVAQQQPAKEVREHRVEATQDQQHGDRANDRARFEEAHECTHDGNREDTRDDQVHNQPPDPRMRLGVHNVVLAGVKQQHRVGATREAAPRRRRHVKPPVGSRLVVGVIVEVAVVHTPSRRPTGCH